MKFKLMSAKREYSIYSISKRMRLHFIRRWLFRERTQLILQTTPVECAAACLAMICSHFNMDASLEDCTERLHPGRNGTSAGELVQAARDFGLRVVAYTVEPEQIKALKLPAIIHWGFNHFVVITHWSSKKAIILDPAKGKCIVPKSTFDQKFTGVILTFDAETVFKSNRNLKSLSSWKFYLKTSFGGKAIKGMLVRILAASLFIQLFGLVLPLFTKFVVDYVIVFHLDTLLPILGIGIVIFVLARILLLYLRSVMLLHMQMRFDSQMTAGIFNHLLSLPYNFFQLRTSGDLIARLSSNANVRNIVTNQFASTAIDGSLVIVYSIILLIMVPSLGIITLGIGLVQVLLIVLTSSRVRSLLRENLSAEADLQAYQVEALKGIATLKATGAEGLAFGHWFELFVRQLNTSLRKDYFFAVVQAFRSSLDTLAPLLLLWLGAYYVINDTITLGTMLAFSALAVSFLTPLVSLANAIRNLQESGAHLDRVMKIIEATPEQVSQKKVAPTLTGDIKVQDLFFQYATDGHYVLKSISLHIRTGQKIAIVGATGAGKSTLGMLLVGLHIPQQGAIFYDDQPLSEIDVQSVRRQIGVVLQEPFLFSGSIRQNIAFNSPEASIDEVMDAAKKACVHEEIELMAMGYDTMVAEGGASLSGGQRQRIALARALVNNPSVLLLDEATSHLDAQTEYDIDQALDSLSCTRIHIAHRLSTVVNADLILFMKSGEILACGPHHELLLKSSDYANLFEKQSFTQTIT